jgi:hypothetical protein
MCHSVRVFPNGFNMTVLHQITIVKLVDGYPKIVLGAASVAGVRTKFHGLHAHLTSILQNFFFGDI